MTELHRKTKPARRKSRTIYLSLNRPLAARLTSEADAESRSISGQIEYILRQHFKMDGAKQ